MSDNPTYPAPPEPLGRNTYVGPLMIGSTGGAVSTWPINTATQTSAASALIKRPRRRQRRTGRTPFRIEIKFTAEEWERLGDLGTARGRSRYNYVKHIALHGDSDWEHHFKDAAQS